MIKKHLKLFLISSLIVNILLIGIFIYIKRTNIKSRINNLLTKETVIENKQLQAMNNIFMPSFVDTCNNINGDKFKILIIGNSLSYHEIAKEIGWEHINGMAATSKEKDFAHLLFKNVEKKLPKKMICLRISNFSTFERNLGEFQPKNLDSLIIYQPDLIVFQLGENVNIQNQNDKSLFEEKYIELINNFKKNGNPLTICTTPFFPSLLKNEIIEKVALTTNSYLVDLSHLPLLNSENYAKDEKNYIGDKSGWKVEGIGIHPGNIGMENIAKQIFITINASIQDKKQ